MPPAHQVETRRIMERLYGPRVAKPRLATRIGHAMGRLLGWVSQHNWHLVLGTLAFGGWASTHIYYYNQIVMSEFAVKETWAHVEAVQQKRNHIQRSLTKLLDYYATYERSLMNEVTDKRVGKTGLGGASATGGSLTGLLGRFNAVAEQYPALHLSSTVQQFSMAIMNTEAEIAVRIMNYNVAVNSYTTLVHTFPSNVFARTLGFEDREFYTPEDPSILEYREPGLGAAEGTGSR